MQVRNKQPQLSLEQQFEASCRETWRLADLLVAARANYEASCTPGVPFEVILMGIQKHQTCKCLVVQDVIRKNIERAKFEGRA
jgi:hypothetical protein